MRQSVSMDTVKPDYLLKQEEVTRETKHFSQIIKSGESRNEHLFFEEVNTYVFSRYQYFIDTNLVSPPDQVK